MAALADDGFVLDGELIVPVGGSLSFDALQARLHPAESRIAKLSAETPAQFMAFDLLAESGQNLSALTLAERRPRLERFVARNAASGLLLSPATLHREEAAKWLLHSGGALDGIVAKPLDQPYRAGERAFVKVKQQRSADCVVGGFRYGTGSREVGSLLLGLYDAAGRLNHVGFTSALAREEKLALTRRLEALIAPPGFTGKAPGGKSRWATERSADWQPLAPELVVEVAYDQVTGDRFRHGTRLLRWRPDKAAAQCRMDQLAPALRPAELEQMLAR